VTEKPASYGEVLPCRKKRKKRNTIDKYECVCPSSNRLHTGTET